MTASWVSAKLFDNADQDDHDPVHSHLADFIDALAIPEWQRDALCREHDADTWFPERGETKKVERAKFLCGLCLVADECRAYALADGSLVGIWAGTAPLGRRAMRREAA